LPLTVAVPTVVPPVVQFVGALVCGPNTVKVTVPPAELVAPDSVEEIEPAAIALPGVPPAGAVTAKAGAFETTVDAIEVPHVLLAALSFASPL
jgi:hypothetical protein